MISLQDVHVRLAGNAGGVHILKGVSLNVEPGETVGLRGPSGSGKSTLLMAAAGLERVSAGKVVIAGTDIGALGEDALARFRAAHIGIVFQSFHLIPTLTAFENVATPLEFAGKADARDQARHFLDQTGLSERLQHYPGELSGGEQQRVALARALAGGARLILADEPTGNLDMETGKHVADLMFDLSASHGVTLFLVTHDPELAGRCGRVIHLEDGQIVE
ncbi:MAG: ABC transporter [Hyphomicrobiales bacterium]|nr:MAG: ABC transporter [Hyphomicrobiales bacterium]